MVGFVPGVDPVDNCGRLGTESAAAGAGAVKGSPDVAWRLESVGSLVAAGAADVWEAVANPESVLAIDPDGMPAARTAGRSGSAKAGTAISGGKRTSMGEGCVDAAFGTGGGEKIAFPDLRRSAVGGRRSAPLVVRWSIKDPPSGTSPETSVAALVAIANMSAAGYPSRKKPVAPIARIAAAPR